MQNIILFTFLFFLNNFNQNINYTFNPILKIKYNEYLKTNNFDNNYIDEIIYCTNKYLKNNDPFELKIFVIPDKFKLDKDSFYKKIILYEFNKSNISLSYLYPSTKSIKFHSKSFENGFQNNTDSFDLSKYLPSNQHTKFGKLFKEPDSFICNLFPYYDSTNFIKSKIFHKKELNYINLKINSIILDKYFSIISKPNRVEFFEDIYVFQIKKGTKFLSLYLSKSNRKIQFQKIIELLNTKFNK